MFATNQNAFSSAYFQSDFVGKGIFWGLFLLSIISWGLVVHKLWLLYHIRRLSKEIQSAFSEKDPLGLQGSRRAKHIPHPLFEVYKVMKQMTLQTLIMQGATTLSESDLGLIEGEVYAAVDAQSQILEKNLFVLSTVVTLAPFLGLLGTVWGILLTFSQLQDRAAGHSASMLSGLALALATTVAGLIVAIPALVGYNYLKNASGECRRIMERFAHHLMTALELRYRKNEDAKTPALQPS